MRLLPLAAVPLSLVLLTGCGELNEITGAIDKTQQCIQAAGIVTETVQKVTGLASDPQAVETALADGANKLENLANDAANTTLSEAANDIAGKLDAFNVQDANDAVDALQKLAADSVAWVETLTSACAGE
ncbi:hypothetical protein FDA94_37720 [Herbidospora galbida]|uniref:Lipoprotein n=1 Tax=Herbidospora galbida TaxID=2575442 RepID=A0A4U3LRX1_9ACTN|nr:hypothetical protein [Herbidospora galbida]TKK77366.1 hypothetical protein FDA94_37720 [Herbidospora galbida]